MFSANITENMGRGRKPSNKDYYFGQREEDAVIAYNQALTNGEKNEIYNDILKPAFTKMVESIIRRYHLYGPEEEYDETFNDTLSFMLTKMGCYKQSGWCYTEIEAPAKEGELGYVTMCPSEFEEKCKDVVETDPKKVVVVNELDDSYGQLDEPIFFKYYELKKFTNKAYSYLQTIVKNYLIQKQKLYKRKIERNTPYEEVNETIENNTRYSETDDEDDSIAIELLKNITQELQKTMNSDMVSQMNPNEVKIGMAINELLRNWEEILGDGGSNKLNKSSVLYFLRETTRLSTKDVRDARKKFIKMYKDMKHNMLN